MIRFNFLTLSLSSILLIKLLKKKNFFFIFVLRKEWIVSAPSIEPPIPRILYSENFLNFFKFFLL